MQILALDIAKRQTGWAIGSVEKPAIAWGVFDTTNRPFLPSWDEAEALHVSRFYNFIEKLHHDYGFESIMYEESFLDAARFSPAGTRATLFFIAMLMLFSTQHCINLDSVAIQTWRGRFVPGAPPKGLDQYHRRKWWKDRSIAACKLRGWNVSNSDEAEALGILDYALSEKDPHYAGSSDPIFHLDKLVAP